MSRFQVGPGTFVTAKVEVFDAEGEEASAAEVTGFVFGMGQLLEPVERSLDGRFEGDTVEVKVREQEAFGERDPTRVLTVDRSDFPPEVAPGDRFEVENLEGGLLVLQVLDVQPDAVVIDTNHPLAGQEILFRLEIQEVRPASEEELEAAEQLLTEDSAFLTGISPDVSVSSLIRRSPPS